MPRWLLMVPVALLAACANLPTPPPAGEADRLQAFESHRESIRALETWQFTGRIAIRGAPEGNGSGTLRWRQQGDDYTLRFDAPLGQGTWQIVGTPGRIEMRTSRGDDLMADDAEALMLGTLGWSVPIEGARYWITGLPDPDRQVQHLGIDAAGHVMNLEQAGWLITGIEYARVHDVSLPRRMNLSRNDLELRLANLQWEIP